MGCFELLSDFVGDALWLDGYGKGHGCRKLKLNTCKFGLTQEGAARLDYIRNGVPHADRAYLQVYRCT